MNRSLWILPLIHVAVTAIAFTAYLAIEHAEGEVGEIRSQTYLHENHAYILFTSGKSFSVVHDPDCMDCRAERLVFPSPRREEPRGLGSAPE